MSIATANGVPLVSLRIAIPRQGAWYGQLSALADAPLDFGLDIELGGLGFSGTARTSSLSDGTAVADFVGGAGGLSKRVTPRSYSRVPLSLPLRDAIGDAGETLASHSARDVTDLELAAWSTFGGKAGHAVNALVRLGASSVLDATWRVLPDGQLWVGVEAWDEVQHEHQVLTADVLADRAVLFMESPALYPGTRWMGRRVNFVEHILRDSVLRTTAWFE